MMVLPYQQFDSITFRFPELSPLKQLICLQEFTPKCCSSDFPSSPSSELAELLRRPELTTQRTLLWTVPGLRIWRNPISSWPWDAVQLSFGYCRQWLSSWKWARVELFWCPVVWASFVGDWIGSKHKQTKCEIARKSANWHNGHATARLWPNLAWPKRKRKYCGRKIHCKLLNCRGSVANSVRMEVE